MDEKLLGKSEWNVNHAGPRVTFRRQAKENCSTYSFSAYLTNPISPSEMVFCCQSMKRWKEDVSVSCDDNCDPILRE